MSRAGKRGPEREPDERLAAFVDDCMSEREHDRFVAELRVNPQLKKDLGEYERTVETVRQALQAPIAKVNVADRVMAQIALQQAESGGGPGGSGRPGRNYRLVVSIVAAAALLVLAVWLNSLPKGLTVGEPTRTDTVAETGAEPPRREESANKDSNGGGRGGVGALAEGALETMSLEQEGRREADGALELLVYSATGEAELPAAAARQAEGEALREKLEGWVGELSLDESVVPPTRSTANPRAPNQLMPDSPAADSPATDSPATNSPKTANQAVTSGPPGEKRAPKFTEKPTQKPEPDARVATGADDFFLGAKGRVDAERKLLKKGHKQVADPTPETGIGERSTNEPVSEQLEAITQEDAKPKSRAFSDDVATLPYLRVTRYELSVSKPGPADPIAVGGGVEPERKSDGGRRQRVAPGGAKAPSSQAGPSTARPAAPGKGPAIRGPAAGGPSTPGSGKLRQGVSVQGSRPDALAAFVAEQLGSAPPVLYAKAAADARRTGRRVIGAVRFEDVTAKLAVVLDRSVGNDEASVGERFWLLEGSRDEVAEMMQRIAQLARAAGHELGNGEVVVPRVGLSSVAPGRSKPEVDAAGDPAQKPAADELQRSPSQRAGSAASGSERMQVVLRFRTVSRHK